ncbi:hypothetical protein SACC_23330 [Saccharolobus caldissimus]|uniref:Uncharacterized protein n=1 Tax=Saccharolobus caldissimus TaxID=1702097 RepID=A0AAQ4CU35_9CREN|nr:hypothetical protein SACC_23330 [Saccharolobus caldissimus]
MEKMNEVEKRKIDVYQLLKETFEYYMKSKLNVEENNR